MTEYRLYPHLAPSPTGEPVSPQQAYAQAREEDYSEMFDEASSGPWKYPPPAPRTPFWKRMFRAVFGG